MPFCDDAGVAGGHGCDRDDKLRFVTYEAFVVDSAVASTIHTCVLLSVGSKSLLQLQLRYLLPFLLVIGHTDLPFSW